MLCTLSSCGLFKLSRDYPKQTTQQQQGGRHDSVKHVVLFFVTVVPLLLFNCTNPRKNLSARKEYDEETKRNGIFVFNTKKCLVMYSLGFVPFVKVRSVSYVIIYCICPRCYFNYNNKKSSLTNSKKTDFVALL